MELPWTVVSCSGLPHDGPLHRCRSSHGKSGLISSKKGVRVHRCRELSSWRSAEVHGGQFGTLELQQRRLWAQHKLQRKAGIVANSLKSEDGDVNSTVLSTEDVQRPVEKGGGGSSSFLTFLCPLLKLIGVCILETRAWLWRNLISLISNIRFDAKQAQIMLILAASAVGHCHGSREPSLERGSLVYIRWWLIS